MAVKAKTYEENGVVFSKKALTEGDAVTLTYTGLLAASGADQVYALVGYGAEWANQTLVSMVQDGSAFSCSFNVAQAGDLNVCFKDSADNWDNNSSENYTVKVKKKAVRKDSAK